MKITPYQNNLIAEDKAANVDFVVDLNLDDARLAAIQAVWASSSSGDAVPLSGTLELLSSLNGVNFDEITGSSLSVVTASGTTDTQVWSVDPSYKYVRMSWTAISGSGQIDVAAYLKGY